MYEDNFNIWDGYEKGTLHYHAIPSNFDTSTCKMTTVVSPISVKMYTHLTHNLPFVLMKN